MPQVVRTILVAVLAFSVALIGVAVSPQGWAQNMHQSYGGGWSCSQMSANTPEAAALYNSCARCENAGMQFYRDSASSGHCVSAPSSGEGGNSGGGYSGGYSSGNSDIDRAVAGVQVLSALGSILFGGGGGGDNGAAAREEEYRRQQEYVRQQEYERQRAVEEARRLAEQRAAEERARIADANMRNAMPNAFQVASNETPNSNPFQSQGRGGANNPFQSPSAASNPFGQNAAAPSPSARPATPSAGTTMVNGETCPSYLRRGRLQMLRLAQQCRASANNLASAQLYIDRIERGEVVLTSRECQSGVQVDSQLSAFMECARVYMCGAQSYSCALRAAPADADAAACGRATEQCVNVPS